MDTESHTEVDTSQFTKLFGKESTTKKIPIVADLHAKIYNTNFARRGRAVIFNHYKFTSDMSPREGTHKDCKDLERVLLHYGFDVTVCDDLKYGEIYDVLNNLASENHSDADCLLICVLTHGENGTLHAKDTDYLLDNLWTPFIGDNCSTLVGKPKLFFIQACRGEKVDDGVRVRADASKTYVLPEMADILVMYSTFDGHYSFRSPSQGSWFIQSLCYQLMSTENNGRDILQILTFVNNQIAIEYLSNVPNSKSFHQKKQVGSIVSSLTKLLYLSPKNNMLM